MQRLYKIALILDEYNVIINGGKNDGIQVGDKFKIFAAGYTVYDPDSNEYIGEIDLTKAVITAHDVRDKMTVCYSLGSNPLMKAFEPMVLALTPEPKRLNVDYDELLNSKIDNDNYVIRIGDLVKPLILKTVTEVTQNDSTEIPQIDN